MTRRAAVAVFAAPFFNRHRYALFAQSSEEYSERAVRLVGESLVIDMLNQFLYRRDRQPKLRQWLSRPNAFTRAKLFGRPDWTSRRNGDRRRGRPRERRESVFA